MISIIIPINHKDRVGQANNLYRLLKEEAGVPVEVITACDNPAIYDLLKTDVLVKLPKRIGFTQSVNVAERFASNKLVWYMDDSVTPTKNWGKIAIDAFYKRFPDANGIMEISGANNCATRCIATREYCYELNLNNLLWPEYIHCGDTEHYERAVPQNKFYAYPTPLLIEKKVNDESRIRNSKIFLFDDSIRDYRRNKGFPKEATPDWQGRLRSYCERDPDLVELYNNIFNL